MAGIMNAPTAEVVAMAEPEIAAKNMQVTVVTMLRPPAMKPMNVSKKFRIRLAMPPPLIRLPASMKKGTAISGKESTPVMDFWVIINRGMVPSPQTRMVNRVAMPME